MADKSSFEETLSALMDSEAQELETRRVLNKIADDPELRDTWHRYQLASAAMKRDLPYKMVDLSRSISESLENEPAYNYGLKKFFQPLGKLAIAASVALVAVLGVQQLQVVPGFSSGGDQAVESQLASTPVENSGAAQFQLPAGIDLPPLSARTVSAGSQLDNQSRPTLVVSRMQVPDAKNEAAIREYLDLMMERHAQNAANTSSSQGVLPLARLPQMNEDN